MAASYHAAAIKPKKHGEAMKKNPVPYHAHSGKPVSAAAGTAAADREPLFTKRLAGGIALHKFDHPNQRFGVSLRGTESPMAAT
jgi:hypothetical protein